MEEVKDFHNQGKHLEAIQCCDQALELSSNIEYRWKHKGFALLKQENLKEGLECIEKALNINPNYAKALEIKGLIYEEQGNLKEAMDMFKKVIEIDPNDKELKEKLADLIKSYSNVTNAPSVVDTKIDGQKAISISYVSHVGYMTLHFENYWVRVQSNAVVEILLSTSADSEESLHSMRPYLSKIKILKKYSPPAK